MAQLVEATLHQEQGETCVLLSYGKPERAAPHTCAGSSVRDVTSEYESSTERMLTAWTPLRSLCATQWCHIWASASNLFIFKQEEDTGGL